MRDCRGERIILETARRQLESKKNYFSVKLLTCFVHIQLLLDSIIQKHYLGLGYKGLLGTGKCLDKYNIC